MSVTVRCPNPSCGRAAPAPDTVLGREVRCKHCHTRFIAAAPAADPAATRTHDAATDPDPTASFADLPARVGRFQVRGRLGAGAAGTVLRAYDPELDREVAIKLPQPGVLDNPRRAERFLREAKAAAKLTHPNIVPVHEAGRDGGTYYIVAAFVPGRPLSQAIPEGGMPARRAARLVRDLAAATAYAHDQGIVHRDIKPANVMLDEHDRPHLMDFGLAARHDTVDRLTHDGAVLGTPAYMAPEQAAGQKGEAQPAGDQYSLGVLLFELLTGEPPFGGPPTAVLYHAIHMAPPAMRSLNPDVPADLEAICRKALSKRPTARYDSCQDLADDLDRWLREEPVRAVRRRPAGRAPRRWLLAGGLAAGLLLGGVAVAVAVHFSRRPDADPPASASLTPRPGPTPTPAPTPPPSAPPQGHGIPSNTGVANVKTDSPPTKVVPEAPARPAPFSLVQTIAAHGRAVSALAFRSGGQHLASGGDDGTLRVWDPWSGQQVLDLGRGSARVSGLAYSADGATLASTQGERGREVGSVVLWQAETGDRVARMSGRFGVAFSADGGRVAACSDETGPPQFDTVAGLRLVYQGGMHVHVWNPAGELLTSLEGHDHLALSVAFRPDGGLASGGADGSVLMWTRSLTDPPTRLREHSGEVTCLAFDLSGRWLAAGSSDGLVVVWDVGRMEVVHRQRGLNGGVHSLAFGPGGQWLAAGGRDGGGGAVRVWEVRTGRERASFNTHGDRVTAVAASASEGKALLATGGTDRAVRVWDVSKLGPAAGAAP